MSESKTLPALIREASDIAALLADAGGEITPELEALVDRSGQLISQKADSYGFVLQALAAQAMTAVSRIEEWNAFLKATMRAEDNLKARMLYGMQSLDLVEISGNQTIFKLQANPPSCIVDDLSKIPGEFLVTKTPPPVTNPDKKAILEAIKAGKEVPGARMERGVRVVMKAGTKRVGS